MSRRQIGFRDWKKIRGVEDGIEMKWLGYLIEGYVGEGQEKGC